MTETLDMAVPTGWVLVRPSEGQRSVAAVASALVSRLDPAAQAAWSGALTSSLTGAFSTLDEDHGELLSLLVPAHGLAADLPVTVAVLRLALATPSAPEANRTLAGIAAKDPTSRLLATDAGPTMRTHAVTRLGGAGAAALGLQPAETPELDILRARYLLPPRREGRWLALVHTIVGVSEETLPAWLRLCDALVMGSRWRRDE